MVYNMLTEVKLCCCQYIGMRIIMSGLASKNGSFFFFFGKKDGPIYMSKHALFFHILFYFIFVDGTVYK